MSWQNGEEFSGEFKENLQTGEGEHKFPSGHYDIAGWDKGLRHGAATYFHPDVGKVTIRIINWLCTQTLQYLWWPYIMSSIDW